MKAAACFVSLASAVELLYPVLVCRIGPHALGLLHSLFFSRDISWALWSLEGTCLWCGSTGQSLLG